MKRFSKVLTVLLMASLLVGALSVMPTTAAEKTGSARLNITNDPNNYFNDFSNNKTGGTYGAAHQSDGDGIKGVKRDNTTGALLITNDPAATANASDVLAGWTMTKWWNNAARYKGSDLYETSFAVLDFEFGAARYWYSYDEDGTVKYKTVSSLSNVKDQIIESGLGFAPGTTLRTHLQTQPNTSTKYDTRKYDDFLFLVQDSDGVWYFSADDKYDESDVKMANRVGVTDHISMVVDSTTTPGTVKYHIYINGEYFSSKALSYTADKNLAASFRGFGVKVPGATKGSDRYAYLLDNIALNWYRTDVQADDNAVVVAWSPYNSGDKYGVDDLARDLANGITNPIYTCDDVLYRGDYYSSNGAVYVDNDLTDKDEGVRTSIPAFVPNVVSQIKNDAKVTAEIDIPNFVVPEGVDNFTLEYDSQKVDITFSDDFLCL